LEISSENEKYKALVENMEESNKKMATLEELLGTERAKFEEEKVKFEAERVNFNQTKQKLEEEIQKLKAENTNLVKDFNDLKFRKNEREEKLFNEIQELTNQLQKYRKVEEDAEDAMDWSMPITTTVKRGTRGDIPGEWRGKSAGGCLNLLSWRHIP